MKALLFTILFCLGAVPAHSNTCAQVFARSSLTAVSPFFEALGAKDRISREFLNNQIKERELIGLSFDGTRVRRMSAANVDPGGENNGIFFYKSGEKNLVLKLLSATDRESAANHETPFDSFFNEVQATIYMGRAGGPKIEEVGIVKIAGDRYYYVAMEAALGVAKTHTFREIADADAIPYFLWVNGKNGKSFVSELATRVWQTLERGYTPGVDPQLVVDKNTREVQWIDGNTWRALPKSQLLNETVRLETAISKMIIEMGHAFEKGERNPKVIAAKFKLELFKRVRASHLRDILLEQASQSPDHAIELVNYLRLD